MALHPSLSQLDHRPWPLPERQWSWRQAWRDLAFLHYPVDAAVLRPLLPGGVTLQEFDGSAWIGVVPFLMDDVMRGSWPAIPKVSTFPELNVRTYVESADGRPGVWFLSLDADSRGIVFGGRTFYRLPYHLASMRIARDGEWYDYCSIRRPGDLIFKARYRPVGEPFFAKPGTFEHWVAERYCLYSRSHRGISRVEVHHGPWPLRVAEVTVERNDLFDAIGLEMPSAAPVCHFSSGVEVVSWGGELLPPV